MNIVEEVEASARLLAQRNLDVDVVYVGMNKYRQLIKESIPITRFQPGISISLQTLHVSSIVTSVGTLRVKPTSWMPPDHLQVGENAIIEILAKLGLKW